MRHATGARRPHARCPHSHAQGDGSKQLKGTATANSQGAQARTATLIRLPLVEVALALVRVVPSLWHTRIAVQQLSTGKRCSHHLLLAAAAPHPRNRRKPRRVKTSSAADTARTRVSQRTRTVAAAAPQATEQAYNSTQPRTAASTVASSAVALRNATAKCAAARHAAQWSDRPCGRTSFFSTEHSTAPPLSLHRIGSAPLRARLLPQHMQPAWLVRHLSHLRFLTPPPPRRWTGSAMATVGRGPSAFASSPCVPAGASRVRAARPSNTNRHATGNGSGAVKHSPQLCRNSKLCVVAATASQWRTAQSCSLRGAAVAHTSLHGVRVSCLLRTRHLPVNRHGTSSVATGKRAANRYNGSTPARSH
ncbi:hypothetical protein ERJ75_000564200 [Trypanosoma vivax]|nr:hypothetical protein ERJ75_000564200 [Trypanosoma vivax]